MTQWSAGVCALALTQPPPRRSGRIYDEESDRHVHISFEQALAATGYGHANGPKGDLFQLSKLTTDVDAKLDSGSKVAQWKPLGQAAIDAGDDAGRMETAADAIIQKIKTDVKAGKWVPVEIVIARPFIEHLMLSAVVAVAGRDTGATLFGPADMCATGSLTRSSWASLVFANLTHCVFAIAGRSRRTRR